jgi:hypothetical protein
LQHLCLFWISIIQVISGAAVDSGFALSIRVTTEVEIPLSSWFDKTTIKALKSHIKDRKTISFLHQNLDDFLLLIFLLKT